MSARIGSAQHDAFPIPIQAGSHVDRTVAEGQSAAATVRIVRLGAMQEKIGVDGYLAGSKFIVDRCPILFCVLDGLI